MIDEYSQTWLALEAYAEKEVSDLLELLEVPGTKPGVTEHLRGRIFSLRQIISLGRDEAPINFVATEDYDEFQGIDDEI